MATISQGAQYSLFFDIERYMREAKSIVSVQDYRAFRKELFIDSEAGSVNRFSINAADLGISAVLIFLWDFNY
jgi:hypothetical protein